MIDITQKGKGAIQDQKDSRDYKFSANFGSEPLPLEFSIKQKIQNVNDQGSSSSCGGQAFGYHMEVNTFNRDNKFVDLSARSLYSAVYMPGGGSRARDLINWLITSGICLEADVPSYFKGQPPTEAYMINRSDITQQALEIAKNYIGATYLTFDSTNPEQVKQAIYQGNGAVIAVVGNNACWQTYNGEIQVPAQGTTNWGHFIFLTGWQLRKGKLYFEFVNSWGREWGDNGFGYLPADYLTAGFGYNEWVVIQKPLVDDFHYQFNTNLQYGQKNEDIKALQNILIKKGYNTIATGYYGELTRKAVLKMQQDYKVDNPVVLWALQGKYVGVKTRKLLNTF